MAQQTGRRAGDVHGRYHAGTSPVAAGRPSELDLRRDA